MSSAAAREFAQHGTLQFAAAELPLTSRQWQQLDALLAEVDYRHIVGGDAGEGHSVHVCRFYNDIETPRALHPRAVEISDIVMSRAMRRFYSRFTGTEHLCLRRCQANRLHAGDYIGTHKDQDSNPDYYATVVFHFDDGYSGGDFVTQQGRQQRHYRPPARSILVNNCTIPHAVAPVQSGERRTLACFLSPEFGPSNHVRHAFLLKK